MLPTVERSMLASPETIGHLDRMRVVWIVIEQAALCLPK
jgi:hypothetical protein